MPTIPPRPERDTPEKLLRTWIDFAYGSKDSLLYEEMLGDEFEFEFLRADAESLVAHGVLPPGSRTWGKASDLRSTGNMFRSQDLSDVTLDIFVFTDVADTSCATCRRIEANATLRLATDPQTPDPRILAIESPQVFIVAKDPSDTTLWVLRKQIEWERPLEESVAGGIAGRSASDLPHAPRSWGMLKAVFY